MKHPDRKTVSRLEELPNIGPSMANTLRLLDIQHPQQLAGKDAYKMYKDLCTLTNKEQDPCVIDVFLAVISFMEGSDPAPWYHFTKERKNHYSRVKQ